MGYRVKGTLKLPDGSPAPNAEIEFISRKNFSPLVQELKSNILCGPSGAYDVTLELGEYAVMVYPGGTYPASLGTIVLAADTVAGQDLPTLLQQAGWQPATPEYITAINAWLEQAETAASNAAGSVVSAKTEADRAKGEADRAKEITGLGTVEDAVTAASVPFPDVWIPFNDSLNMLAGYGTEIKVGTDVVARKVDFTRASTATYIDKSGVLRTAAINEPRFEKEGLLIEGQSTNMFLYSQRFIDGNWSRVNGVASPTPEFPGAVLLNAGDNVFIHANVPLEIGKTYTISVVIKGDFGSAPLAGKFANVTGPTLKLVSRFGEYSKYSSTMTVSSLPNLVVTGLYCSAGLPAGVTVCAIQIEALPLATSYIPTNGAAATRAEDVVSVSKALNNCVEFYSGKDALLPTVGTDKITISPVTGKKHIRNVKGFFSPLTSSQKAALK